MTTVINSPAPSSDNNTGLIIGIFALIIFGFIFVYYGIPALRTIGTPQINVPAPVINLPNQVDVNVKSTN